MRRACIRKWFWIQVILGWIPAFFLLVFWDHMTLYAVGLLLTLELLLAGMAYVSSVGEAQWKRGPGAWSS